MELTHFTDYFLRPYMWNYSMPQDGTIELATYIKMLKYSSCGCAEDIYKSTLGSSYKTVIRKKKKKKKKKKKLIQFSSVAQLCSTLCDPWTAARQASLYIMNSWSLLKLMTIVLVMLSNHLILCHPLRLPP